MNCSMVGMKCLGNIVDSLFITLINTKFSKTSYYKIIRMIDAGAAAGVHMTAASARTPNVNIPEAVFDCT